MSGILHRCKTLGLPTLEAIGGAVHPAELGEHLAAIEPCVGTVFNPYVVSLLDASHVWVCVSVGVSSARPSVWSARLSAHPDWELWRGRMDPGEFWSSVGEEWVKQCANMYDVAVAAGAGAVACQIKDAWAAEEAAP